MILVLAFFISIAFSFLFLIDIDKSTVNIVNSYLSKKGVGRINYIEFRRCENFLLIDVIIYVIFSLVSCLFFYSYNIEIVVVGFVIIFSILSYRYYNFVYIRYFR